mmetsp:Transcript_63353/g.100685  ORF Transcript_63353/g.100685 Transcript_63353/m.100685 type:complete len:415 (+) Transcript_63353:3-1247(+)
MHPLSMAAEELLELEINGLGGRLCHLKLERFRLRIEDIKGAIEESTGVPALEQRLFLGSLELIRLRQLLSRTSPVEVMLVRRTKEQLSWLEVLSTSGKKYQNAPPDVQRDKEVIQSVLNQDWRLLKHVPAELQGEIEIVEIALESGAPATRVVPNDMRRCKNLAKLAVKYDGSALKHFDPEVMDKELVMAAVERYPSAFDFIPEVFHQDRDVLFSAVQQEGTCLEYASAKLRGDKELVLAAVRQEGMALEYATEDLKAHRPVVLEAVTMDGCALQFASDELRSCPRVIRRALNSDGLALEFADEKMRDSKDLVLMAIESDPRAFEFASQRLRHDPAVILETLLRATKGYARESDRTEDRNRMVDEILRFLSEQGLTHSELREKLRGSTRGMAVLDCILGSDGAKTEGYGDATVE